MALGCVALHFLMRFFINLGKFVKIRMENEDLTKAKTRGRKIDK
ncbi:hypothetical protein TREAZ_1244 [Leadbettera azotonutricia ZAS-9]|uniref:Uncharacterized protein n=1 Tax=Leadbettera azotonutricia (strain ATCC BAA-888 / DSM 13862 / ZAS-9) TaxID=545695 RepID=F5Y6M6_LEAAZ|nr:hypothetical protein TREAZ_1244 [Leadbettera azotonutricia ZAS-9]